MPKPNNDTSTNKRVSETFSKQGGSKQDRSKHSGNSNTTAKPPVTKPSK